MHSLSSVLTKKEKTFFKAAEVISTLSDHRVKLGCVVVDHHRIISSGHNSKTQCHTFQKRLDNKFFPQAEKSSCGPLHAEVAALLPLLRKKVDLTNATLYIFRKNGCGEISMSRPCSRCMSVIKECGIKKIKYTTPDGFVTEKII